MELFGDAITWLTQGEQLDRPAQRDPPAAVGARDALDRGDRRGDAHRPSDRPRGSGTPGAVPARSSASPMSGARCRRSGWLGIVFPIALVLLGRGGIGFVPAVIALTALGIPPIVTNTYAGMRGVDADLVEAGRGMGMRESELVRRVEVPVALPVILAGIRISAVQIVATATLAAIVGRWDPRPLHRPGHLHARPRSGRRRRDPRGGPGDRNRADLLGSSSGVPSRRGCAGARDRRRRCRARSRSRGPASADPIRDIGRIGDRDCQQPCGRLAAHSGAAEPAPAHHFGGDTQCGCTARSPSGRRRWR